MAGLAVGPRTPHSIDLMDHIEANLRWDPTTDCLEWQLSCSASGHGQLSYKGKSHKVHRKYYEMAHGIHLPAEIKVRHTCDNPPCCYLGHLIEGTVLDNVRDMWARGRARPGIPPRGELHHNAKVSSRCAVQIRELTAPLRVIALAYGIGLTTVKDIRSGKRWT